MRIAPAKIIPSRNSLSNRVRLTNVDSYKIHWVKKERAIEHADELMMRVECLLNEFASEGWKLKEILPNINTASGDWMGVFVILNKT